MRGNPVLNLRGIIIITVIILLNINMFNNMRNAHIIKRAPCSTEISIDRISAQKQVGFRDASSYNVKRYNLPPLAKGVNYIS